MVIPGLNDSDEKLGEIARFLCSVDPGIPWHVSQFYPAWKMQDRPATPIETLDRARKIGEDAGLRYVYEGNAPGSGGENTRCPRCGTLLIERYGLTLLSNRAEKGRCPDCGGTIDGVAMDGGRLAPALSSSPSGP